MAGGTLSNVQIAGIAGAVPSRIQSVRDIAGAFQDFDAARFEKNAGVKARHVVLPEQCTSDLCVAAASSLLEELGWEHASVDLVVFVSTSPDYFIPSTACTVHRRLGLSPSCAVLDVPHGCSGYVYGLWVAASMVAAGQAARALFLAGETTTRFVSPQDSTLFPLVGDGGSATALLRADDAPPMEFAMHADGSGMEHLWIKGGAYRHPSSEQTRARTERLGPNVVLSDEDLAMDGQEIFAFALKQVPVVFDRLLARTGWSVEDLDAVVLHQANRLILQTVGRKMKVPPEKMADSLARFGNTSSASIPLTVVAELADRVRTHPSRLAFLAFGAGLSWGGAFLQCGPLAVPPLTLVGPER